jgi:hypothetical protein
MIVREISRNSLQSLVSLFCLPFGSARTDRGNAKGEDRQDSTPAYLRPSISGTTGNDEILKVIP